MSDLVIKTCQYIGPHQDPRIHRIHFCGAPVIEGKSYCAEHYGIIYQAGTSITSRRKIKELDRELKIISAKDTIGVAGAGVDAVRDLL